MKALVNQDLWTSGADMPDLKIKCPIGVLVKMTTTNLCSSDLRVYGGRGIGDL